MYKLIQYLILLNALLFPFSAIAHKDIKVVASFSILADLVKNVGKDRVSITTFVGSDENTHIYEPTPRDAQALKNAHIIFINGLHLEDFIHRLITATNTKALLVETSANIPLLKKQDHQIGHHHKNNTDPHAWHTIPNVKIYIKNITTSLCKIDPESCGVYNTNANAYIQKLDALHKTITTQIAAIPKDKRIIITSHDAFDYFAHEYGFTILAPEGVSTEIEATAANVAKLIQQIKTNNASALFVENISNPRLIEQIAKETGLKISGTLYSDALSKENGPAATYLDMMQHNVTTIINAITKH
ncbi:metal ABC transporter solute-binding protein, Zn/Mn family [Bartonella sp. F02]|uniref:metal ABC transporter solute-binding protein, Zn/Mn family n=1 Tax=Bartonella sp. F02 TaxID=2967262 RepID=UPI0022A9D4F2|nr:zinc ABC transporter substrate-binding protein [Bartonella sp. F02]MCZ2328422.1 zinc ABC transporter substrate-binding protein [Bartonella sp. F02]